MLSCKDISNIASDYLDSNLSTFMKMKVKMHLFMCHRCRNFVNQLKSTIDTLHSIKTPSPEKSVIDRQVNELLEIAKNLKNNSKKTNDP